MENSTKDEKEIIPLESDSDTSGNEIETPPSDKNWEEKLSEKMTSKDMQKKLRREKRLQFKQQLKVKKQELNAKTTEFVEGQFTKVFDKRVILYTILFLLLAIAIGILSTNIIPESTSSFFGRQNLIITLTLMGLITYIFLFVLSRNRKLHHLIFAEKRPLVKIIIAVLVLILSGVLCWLYWKFVDPYVITFLKYQPLFGVILALVYFGWNAIQILFLKTSVEKQSIGLEARFQIKNETVDAVKKGRKITASNVFNILGPWILHILFTFLFIFLDTDTFYGWLGLDLKPRFIPDNFLFTGQGFTAFFTQYFPEVWWNYLPLRYLLIWIILVTIVLIFTTRRQIQLYRKSARNETRNIFSGWFYLIFWVFLYMKFYSIVNTLMIYAKAGATNDSGLIYLILDWISSVVLMILTVLNLTRGFTEKIRKGFKIEKKSSITEYNISLLLFFFVISYWGGQWVLISGNVVNKEELSIITNLLVVVIFVAFYYWYGNWVLERRGFIRKTSYTTPETRQMMIELSQRMKNRLLQTIENNEIITNTLNEYMLERKIVLEEGQEEEAVVESLEKPEEERTTPDKYTYAQLGLEDASQEKLAYEKAVKDLKDAKQHLSDVKIKVTTAQKAVDTLEPDLEAKFQTLDTTYQEVQEKLKAAADVHEKALASVDKVPQPTDPGQMLTPTGEVDEALTKIEQEKYQAALDRYEALIQEETTTRKVLDKIQKELDKLTPKREDAKNKLEDARQKQRTLQDLHNEISSVDNRITALEQDIVLLKERATLAQPLLDAANLAYNSANHELQTFNALNTAKDEEQNAEHKLSEAETLYSHTEQDLKNIREILGKMKIIPELETELQQIETTIADLEQNIQEMDQKIADQRSKAETQGILVDESRTQLNTAKETLQLAEKAVTEAIKKREKLQAEYDKGERLQQELAAAQDEVKKIAQEKKDHISIEDAETAVISAEDAIRDCKADIKTESKNEPRDSRKIDKLHRQLDEYEVALKNQKQLLKEVKSIQSNYDDIQKKVTQLENRQINLPQAQASIDEASEEVKKAEAAKELPLQDHDAKTDDFHKQQDVLAQMKEGLTAMEQQMKGLRGGLTTAANNLQQVQLSLEDRKEKEENERQVDKVLAEALDILNSAKATYTEKQEIREEKQKIFDEAVGGALLDHQVFVAEKALKQAHKTFKDAVAAAEINVIRWEERVADAKQKKTTASEK